MHRITCLLPKTCSHLQVVPPCCLSAVSHIRLGFAEGFFHLMCSIWKPLTCPDVVLCQRSYRLQTDKYSCHCSWGSWLFQKSWNEGKDRRTRRHQEFLVSCLQHVQVVSQMMSGKQFATTDDFCLLAEMSSSTAYHHASLFEGSFHEPANRGLGITLAELHTEQGSLRLGRPVPRIQQTLCHRVLTNSSDDLQIGQNTWEIHSVFRMKWKTDATRRTGRHWSVPI